MNCTGNMKEAAAGRPGKIETGSSSQRPAKGHTVRISDYLKSGKDGGTDGKDG